MEFLTKALLIIHIATGFLSVVIFWLPMLTKKGSKWHVLSGKIYVYAMWVVTISAALLCIKNVAIENYNSAIFLGFICFITAGPLWHGIAILNFKKGPNPTHIKIQLGLNLIILFFALFMIGYNTFILEGKHILMYVFGGLGLTSIPEIRRGLRGLSNGRNRIQEHAIGMVTTAIAAYTAFFAFGGREFFGSILTGNWMLIPWIAPGILGTIANIYYGRKYASKKTV